MLLLSDEVQALIELKLQLKVDKGVQLGMVVKVWDEARKAKIEISDIPLRILTGRKN
jgi:hypothetical protein